MSDLIDRCRMWYRLLMQEGQASLWKPQDSDMTTLAEMDESHRRNVLEYLRRHHRRIVSLAYWGVPDGMLGLTMAVVGPGGQPTGETVRLGEPRTDASRDAFDDACEAEWEAMTDDPTGWFESTPFITTLREMVEADEARVPALPGSGITRRRT